MEKEILNELKGQLEAKKAELIKQLGSIGHQEKGEKINFTAKFPEYGTSDEDNATEIADYTKNLSYEKELEDSLKDINKALEKIKDGSYGQCENCGKEIDAERLKVSPEARVCVDCSK